MNSSNKWILIPVILLAMSLIPFGDTAGKLMMQQGVSPIFVAWSRALIGALCLLPFSGLRFAELSLFFDWRIVLRALLFVGAVTAVLQGIKTEPLANVFGAFFIAPILAYFLAALLLKEKITKLRSILLLIGFIGALMVIKPGFGMTHGIGFAVLGGCFYGCLLVANRWLADNYRPRFILVSALIIGALVMAPFSIDSIPDLNTEISLLVLWSALASAVGNLLIIEVARKLSASVVAPFVYTQLIAATFFGYIVFDNLPDGLSLLGLLILLCSGFASFFVSNREK
ncbi:MAG: DMT family transporter [Cocleimonas sp.]